jgi:dihydroorotate dehydrogenase (NAD+) catalytic subunit
MQRRSVHPMSLPTWLPTHPPIYDINLSYLENIEKGPFFSGKLPKRELPPQEKWIDFLGHYVASPLSVPAGPLLSSKWTELAGKLGFDIVVYKTIRSHAHPAHNLPNMIYVDTDQAPPAIKRDTPQDEISRLGVTNSFGMPSMSQAFIQEDIARANETLSPGQVLVVSVVGSPRPNEDFLEDFVKTAQLAVDAGAKIIEANFSCPNVSTKDGILYNNPDTVLQYATEIVEAISPIPVIIKVGTFHDESCMRQVFVNAAKAGVRAVSGINTVSMPVVDQAGEPALCDKRLTSGVCGGPIRPAALEFTKNAARIIHEEKLDLMLMSGGGITKPEHFDSFLNAGADIVWTATGMMWDPYLAMRYHERHGNVEA